ncbi:MAG: hypothetical protein WCK02_16060 [Bacteroidota bacterium]
MLNEVEIKKIKNKLPKGWQKEIAIRSGFSKAYVSLVINGKRDCRRIVDISIFLIKEYAKEKKQFSEFINSL